MRTAIVNRTLLDTDTMKSSLGKVQKGELAKVMSASVGPGAVDSSH